MMTNLRDTLVMTTGLVMGTAVGVLTTALGFALLGAPWELHFSTHSVAAVAIVLVGITVVAQGVVIVIDLLAGSPLRSQPEARLPDKENVMGTQRMLSWLIILIGLVLAITPWLLRFATDRVAELDVVIGGAIVALVGVALVYAMPPEPTQRLSH